ncbi:hypothetical protein [Nostoc sp. DedQUE07]|uniref:hypothetical protein n=1 Tax=Nostoc sp. DedQUE07 TaxID=3075392 RepID=UPI002AD34356|nr:hypothetical protein [Nostoc sp. DedQUE07]MDZ8133490.1 hypothetical protein [Nostoc sp. DedQUE07]
MFTRSELEIKTVPELQDLCRRYGIRPTGSAAYKPSYITSLIAFPILAIQQMEVGRGLKSPSLASIQVFSSAIDEMGTPTNEQIALIRITLEGRRMSYPDRFEQERLLNLHLAKMRLEQVIALVSQ